MRRKPKATEPTQHLKNQPSQATPKAYLPVHIVSAYTLEHWDWRTPWTTGIGGSEVSHIEMSQRLGKLGVPVTSWAPMAGKTRTVEGVKWRSSGDPPRDFGKSIVINYRDPQLFSTPKNNEIRWFVAQDVDYEGHWTPERLASVDRYLCLCEAHASYTQTKYPQLRGKVYISSNGVRKDYLEAHPELATLKREPHRMLYASSPDRGLKILLENWFRVRERYPKAELRVAYGFDNMEKIIQMQAGGWHAGFKQNVEGLLRQEGVTWLGRLPQDKLYEEWFQASVLPYPSDWPETSMITIMDAMACGAVPVTTNHWAQGQHGLASGCAYVVDGLPQKSDLCKMLWLDALYRCLDDQPRWDAEGDRERMMTWARESYDWDRLAEQWRVWVLEDSKLAVVP